MKISAPVLTISISFAEQVNMGEIKGYSVGDIQAKAAFTSEIEINGRPPVQGVVNHQDKDREIMDSRPGMYLKYVLHRYDAVDGQLCSGGAYLFDTYENAAGYADWTANVFEVNEPKEKFWSQALFKTSKRFVWDVIGATNFAPIDVHAVGRFQRWSYSGPNAERELQEAYADLKKKARDQGAVAFWLLHQPLEKQIGIQLVFRKLSESVDPVAVGRKSLAQAAAQPSLGSSLPSSIAATRITDYVSLFLAIWLPRSRLSGGVHHSTPMYPTLPAVDRK